MSQLQALYNTTITDPITDRYQLEAIVEIPDMQVYIEGWKRLADKFRDRNMWTNAAMCDAKAAHYQKVYEAEWQILGRYPEVKLELELTA